MKTITLILIGIGSLILLSIVIYLIVKKKSGKVDEHYRKQKEEYTRIIEYARRLREEPLSECDRRRRDPELEEALREVGSTQYGKPK